jgi:uncharacterized protein (TIGR02246 family)
MNRHSLSIIACFSALTVTAQALAENAQQCHAVTEQQVAALFDRWNTDLGKGDPDKVVENYADNSILLPTLSNTPRRTAEEKQDYFVHFLEQKPSGTVNERMIQIDCNTALDAGIYTFSFADGHTVKARYTFTYKWFPDKQAWLITSHHSSAMPEIVPLLN